MVVVCMFFSLLGNVIFSAGLERDLDSEVKTVRFFDLPAKWASDSAEKEGKERWMACNADVCGLKECSFEQDGFLDILTLHRASQPPQKLVFIIDRSVNAVKNGDLCNISVRQGSLGEPGFGNVEASRQPDDRKGRLISFYPKGRSSEEWFYVGANPTPPQVPCCYDFGRSKLTVRRFFYDDVAEKKRCLLWFNIDYKDFRRINIGRGTSSLDGDVLDGEATGYHFGTFSYHYSFYE